MKFTTFILSLCLASFTMAEGVDLLRNGSFEDTFGLDEAASFWAGGYVRTQEEAHEGQFSARCQNKGAYCEANSSAFKVAASSQFELTGYYKGTGGTVYAFFGLEDNKSNAMPFSIGASPDKWTEFKFTGTAPENAINCRVLLRSWAKEAPVFFDSVHFFGQAPVSNIPAVTTAAGIDLEISTDANEAVVTARSELENYLPKTVKNSIKIAGKQLRKITIQVDNAMPDEEAWSVASDGDTLTLKGGSPRGALYATYHFLEDCLGIHWWTPWEESVPAPQDWAFKRLSLSGKPYFSYRDIYRSTGHLEGDFGRFAARIRLNRIGDERLPIQYGGSKTFGPPYFVHTFARYVSNEVLKTHPEYLALANGRRDGTQYSGQLCLSNKELRDLLTRRMIAHIISSRSEALSNGLPPPVYYDLSQNDGRNFCECEDCKKFIQETSLTDLLMDFVNDIADRIGQKFPDVLVTTLAYQATVFPPKKIMPHDNVVIRLCDTQLADGDINTPRHQDYLDSVKQWSKVAKHLMCWEYSLAHWPYPDDIGVQKLCQMYKKHNFDSLFIEMSAEDYLLDCFDMKYWLYAKMMEQPDADFESIRQVFIKGYYGAAAPCVDKWRKTVAKASKRLGTSRIPSWHRPVGFDFFTVDELLQAHKMFDEAEKAVAGDSTLELRLMRVRAPLNMLTGQRYAKYAKDWAAKGNSIDSFPLDRSRIAENMRRVWCADTMGLKEKEIQNVFNTKESQISFVENMSASTHEIPEPPEFKGHKVEHFTPSALTLHNNPNMKLIKDPDAREGCAFLVTCTPREEYFRPPFLAGCYDTFKAKVTLEKKWDTFPKERGFQWLRLGRDTLNMKHYVFLTGSWEIQASMGQYLEFGAKDLDIWIRIKFEGPWFYPEDQGKENRIVVDSISFVEL